MLLRIALRRVVFSQAVYQITQKTRHNSSRCVSSVFRKVTPPPSLQTRCFSSVDEFEEDEAEEDDSLKISQLVNKYLSYDQEHKDELLREIENFTEIDQVIQCIEENLEQLGKRHIIQLLLLTRKLRNRNDLTIIKNLDELVAKIEKFLPEFDNETELGAVGLHLRLLGKRRDNETMQKIIEEMLQIFKTKGGDSELIAISMFTEMLSMERDLYCRLLMIDTLPVIKQKSEAIDNELDFFHFVSCLNNIHVILSQDAQKEFKTKIEEFFDKNIVTNSRAIFKTINFLNFPHWSSLNADLNQKLLLLLQNRVDTLDAKELLKANKALFVQYEPASLIAHLKSRALKLLEKTQDIELLQIVCLYCSVEERAKYAEMFRDKVMKIQTTLGSSTDSLSTFFKILRLLKISDSELCDCFWTKIVNKVFSLPLPVLKTQLPKFWGSYMNFNNNLGGTYRHIEFEKIMYEYCMEEMKTTSAHIPKDYAKLASFVIAYADQYESIPPFVIEKLIMMQEQLSVFDCKMLARALEIVLNFRARSPRSITLDNQIEILQFILDTCAQRHMQDPDLSIKDVNVILTSHVRRRAPRDSQLFYEILNWYKREKLPLNSRTIREICQSLKVTKFSMDPVCDQFLEYVVKNKELVTGETVEKILTACYNLSYFPENMEALDHCSDIINRDFDVMTGLSVVQSLLALTFYKAAPYELVTRVFNGDFIKKLEQEVEMAYSKDTYPRRVLTLVMQLNRAICLDHPEYNIRWFQQNFIEAQMSKRPVVQTKFHSEVHRLLLNIVPSHQYLAINKNTPYGYRIDFEIHVDKNYNKFLKIDPEDYMGTNFNPKVNKIAILLLGFDTFCINDVNRLKGPELLRMRHLEMMNYKVIHVKRSDFKMLYENVAAKINHLKKLLQISG